MISHLLYAFLILTIIQSTSSVVVRLETGATGTFEKDVKTTDVDVILECNPDGDGSLQWSYKKSESSGSENSMLDASGVLKPEYNSMFQLSNKNLIIKTVESDKAGVYTCRVVPSTGSTGVGSYILTVLVPPSTPICGFPGDHAITVGHSAQFTCSSNGMPIPTYEWFKDNIKLSDSAQNSASNVSYDALSGVLSFKKVTTADAGNYHCLAKSRAGESQCTPIKITTKDQDVGAIVGIVFGCIFGVLLIAVLIFWTCRKGYCDGFTGKDDDDDSNFGDEANDVMLDGTGPTVNKPPSEVNGVTDKHEASMMI